MYSVSDTDRVAAPLLAEKQPRLRIEKAERADG